MAYKTYKNTVLEEKRPRPESEAPNVSPDGPYSVYLLRDPTGRPYVGHLRGELNSRWRNGRNYQNNHELQAAIDYYGWENFSKELLRTNLTYRAALGYENYNIVRYNALWPNGYNNWIIVDGKAEYHGPRNRPVILTNKSTGEKIYAPYPAAAAKMIGYKGHGYYDVLSGKKTFAGGYDWQYADEIGVEENQQNGTVVQCETDTAGEKTWAVDRI